MTPLSIQVLGLVLAISVLVFLVLRTKVHAFLAMLIAGCIAGIIGGLSPSATVAALTKGFGNTLASIGIVIGLGIMMGRLLEVSGAAERIAYSLIKWLGKRKEDWALAITGYIVSIPIFVDSAFVVLYPIAKALAKKSGRSIITLAVALGGGLLITHHVVPPTPGPLAAAAEFKIDVGLMILAGMAISIPSLIAMVFYAQWLGRKYPDFKVQADDMPEDLKATYDQYMAEKANKELPSFFISVLPIVVPVLLIFIKAMTGLVFGSSNPDLPVWVEVINFIGTPVIALSISVLLAIYTLSGGMSRENTLDRLEEGIQTCGIILLVTGAGGALGEILRASGTGKAIAEYVAALPIPAIMIPFIIATLVRLVQGSGTVSIVTAASISAPILLQIPDVNLLLAALAATIGSTFFGSFNDSLFWVVNRMVGVKSPKDQTIIWSGTTTIAWAVGLVTLLIADMIW